MMPALCLNNAMNAAMPASAENHSKLRPKLMEPSLSQYQKASPRLTGAGAWR